MIELEINQLFHDEGGKNEHSRRVEYVYRHSGSQEQAFNVSQISRRLDIFRTTVYKYLNITLKEMEQVLKRQKTRKKKLDKQRDLVKCWLLQYPDMSSAQVLDWLQERKLDGGVCP